MKKILSMVLLLGSTSVFAGSATFEALEVLHTNASSPSWSTVKEWKTIDCRGIPAQGDAYDVSFNLRKSGAIMVATEVTDQPFPQILNFVSDGTNIFAESEDNREKFRYEVKANSDDGILVKVINQKNGQTDCILSCSARGNIPISFKFKGWVFSKNRKS